MLKKYDQPTAELLELILTDTVLYSYPTANPDEPELPILSRYKDDLAADGLSQYPTEPLE